MQARRLQPFDAGASMNNALIPTTLAVCLAAGTIAVFSGIPNAQAQAAGAARLVPLGASGPVAWYLDIDKKQVVMCNAFSDNSIECRSKPMP
jgi:hypothetical protein